MCESYMRLRFWKPILENYPCGLEKLSGPFGNGSSVQCQSILLNGRLLQGRALRKRNQRVKGLSKVGRPLVRDPLAQAVRKMSLDPRCPQTSGKLEAFCSLSAFINRGPDDCGASSSSASELC